MKIALLFVALLLPVAFASAQLRENSEFRVSQQALRDDLPEVAVQKLKRLFTSDFGTDEKVIIGATLLESMVRAEQSKDALRLAQHEMLLQASGTPFWSAIAHSQLNEYAQADQLLKSYSEMRDSPFYIPAALSRANLLVLMRVSDEALEVLQEIVEGEFEDGAKQQALLRAVEINLDLGRTAEAETQAQLLKKDGAEPSAEVAYLLAELAMAKGELEKAIDQFQALANEEKPKSRYLRDSAQIGLADALTRKGDDDEVVNVLVRFINENQESSVLYEAFQRLDFQGFFQRDRIENVMEAWLNSNHPELQGLALFYASKFETDPSKAIPRLEAFRATHPEHSLVPMASLRLAEAYVTQGATEQAQKVLNSFAARDFRAEMGRYAAHIAGLAKFEAGAYPEALDAFRGSVGKMHNSNALFNAAVSAIYGKSEKDYLAEYQRLGLKPEAIEVQAELELELALHKASIKDPEAVSAMLDFVKAHPDHSRIGEARLALAEIYLNNLYPPKTKMARAELEGLRELDSDPETAEQIDYVGFWIEAIEGNEAAALRSGRGFLGRWKESKRRAELHLKLGEIYYSNKDYPNARTQFELAASTDIDGPHWDAAMFYSGKAASLSMNTKARDEAIAIWGKIIERGGAFANEAMRHTAMVRLLQDQPGGAVTVLKEMLQSSGSLGNDLKYATLLNLGEAYSKQAEMNFAQQHGKLIAAIATFDKVLDSSRALRVWKNEAAVRKANCLEKLSAHDEALEVYYDVVSRPPDASLRYDEVPEFHWFYRAGFSAINLLLKDEKWLPAVKLAERLAETSEPRGDEAADLANRLRLQHGIWETDE